LFCLKLLVVAMAAAEKSSVAAASEASPAAAAVEPEELVLPIGDGRVVIAGQMWRPTGGRAPRARILAVHGTLDNCGSFAPLAPHLAAAGYCVFAMDLSGHGRSAWRPGGFYQMAAWVIEIFQTLTALGADWSRAQGPLVLMGHSLGAGLCSLAAGAFPSHFSAAILIDGLGVWAPRTPEQMKEMAKSGGYAGRNFSEIGPDYYRHVNVTKRIVDTVLKLDAKMAQGPKEYESLDAAIEARVASTNSSPVGQRITQHAARAIVRRGSRVLPSGRVVYAHDSRITVATNNGAMHDEDALGYLQRMPRALLLHGDRHHTWPGIHERTEARLAHLDTGMLEVKYYPGEAHHLHADSPELVLPAILEFLGGVCSAGEAKL